MLVLLISIFTRTFSFLGLIYTDPGTGALVLQLLVAGVLGTVFYLRYFTKRARSLFSRKRWNEKNSEAAPESGVELSPTSPESHEEDRVA